MKETELRRCQIAEWYPDFKQFTIRTLFHPLPDTFLRYLEGLPPVSGDSDGEDDRAPPPFLLPRPASGRDPLPRTTDRVDPTSLLDSSTSFSDDDDEEEEADAPSFPELESAVERSIAALGGAAFPKLNWSAPKDAAWIAADGTLRCSSFADVALILRASDSIAHDLSQALPSCSDIGAAEAKDPPFGFYLALRKWYPSLRPEMEFRCFVRRKILVGVSQREVTNFYPVLLDRRDEIQPLIEQFFVEVVKPRFQSESYTFDVYVTGDGRVKLIDFNPWGAFTLPLLFSWEELEKEENGQQGGDTEENGGRALVEFRIVEGQCGVRPGLKTAVPFDYLDTGEGSGWDQFLKKADEEFKKQSQSQQHDVEG